MDANRMSAPGTRVLCRKWQFTAAAQLYSCLASPSKQQGSGTPSLEEGKCLPLQDHIPLRTRNGI